MRPKAWHTQLARDKRRLGKAAPWKVEWRDPCTGLKKMLDFGAGVKALRAAKRKARELHAQIVAGVYDSKIDKSWAEFVAEYDEKILSGRATNTRIQVLASFANFDRLCRPGRVSKITTNTIDGFTAKRQKETKRVRCLTESDYVRHKPRSGPLKGQTAWMRKTKSRSRVCTEVAGNKERALVSPATVNADLRNLRAALTVAADWKYLSDVPKFRFVQEAEPLPVFIPLPEFVRMYAACHAATLPRENAAEWWRCFLVATYMTGWRVGEVLPLERSAIDWQKGEARIWNQKAKREEETPLHPLVLDHLAIIRGTSNRLFPWPHHRRTLTAQLYRICKAAGVRRYSFHNLRKSFCSVVAAGLSLAAVQRLARHRSLRTTQKHYVNVRDELAPTVSAFRVPAIAM